MGEGGEVEGEGEGGEVGGGDGGGFDWGSVAGEGVGLRDGFVNRARTLS